MTFHFSAQGLYTSFRLTAKKLVFLRHRRSAAPLHLSMPWHWRLIGLDCNYRTVQANMVPAALDGRWNAFDPVDEETVAKLYLSGRRCGRLFLGHIRSDRFEVHHHVEGGMVLSNVEGYRSPDYAPLYMLCRWRGPKSVVTVEREQATGDECMVRAFKLSGEQMFEKKSGSTTSNWFSIAQEVHALDAGIKVLMFVEGKTVVDRIWWPLRLDQKLPLEGEWRVLPDELDDLWDGFSTSWGEVFWTPPEDSDDDACPSSPDDSEDECLFSPEVCSPGASSPGSSRMRSGSRSRSRSTWRGLKKDHAAWAAISRCRRREGAAQDMQMPQATCRGEASFAGRWPCGMG